MTLRCLMFGHRRSRSRATFDEKHKHWMTECKRCHILLVRGPDGKWRPLPPQPTKLVPIEPEPAEESASASRGAGETPLSSAGAADAANGRLTASGKNIKQTVKLPAS